MFELVAKRRSTAVIAEATDFDGTNDYLSRSSDLSGNADGKTFTLGFWYYSPDASCSIMDLSGTGQRFGVGGGGGNIQVIGKNTSGTEILNVSFGVANSAPENTWNHVLISVDLSNLSNRHVYLNDEEISSPTWTTYTNDDIDFTSANPRIAENGGGKNDQRLAGVYLDYTYRDLSVASNRRDFISADLRYVDPPTSGIISVPLTDPTAPGTNNGTGGDFTLNGTVARSGRGPNQYNAAASTLDGSADYLSRTSALSGATNGKTITIGFWLKMGENIASSDLIYRTLNAAHTTVGHQIAIVDAPPFQVAFRLTNSSGTVIADYSTTFPEPVKNKWHHFAVSVDLTDTNKRHVYFDGQAVSVTWSTYTNDTIDFTTLLENYIGANWNGSSQFDGELSDFWLDTTYIDLSTSNPFYDTTTGKPKDLGVDGSTPTGTSPLIYLPLRGDAAGSNKGTGGDFTVNSGPYTGARGPSEPWLGCIEFDGTGDYLTRGADFTGNANSKLVLGCLAVKRTTTGAEVIFDSSGQFRIEFNASNELVITGQDTGANTDLSIKTSAIADTNWHTILFSIDMAGTIYMYVDGSSDLTTTAQVDDTLNLTAANHAFGGTTAGGTLFNGRAALWLGFGQSQDLSQEANRLKWIDAFGYPTDWASDGSTPTGTAPIALLTSASGANGGTGGAMTSNGDPADGGFVKG